MSAEGSQSPGSSKRSSAISQSDVHDILLRSSNPAVQPSPIEHISASRPTSAGLSQYQHAGEASVSPDIPPVQPNVRSNRFSLTFPILPPSKEESPTRRSISPIRDTFPLSTELVSTPADPADGNFLTAIAAEERRVLEIKEELQKAEAELKRLKLLWSGHEAQKKKSETRRVTKLRPLSVALPTTSSAAESPGSATWQQQQQDVERRRILLASQRTSRGTVFSGSKHTRTLSLLAPVQNKPPSQPDSPNRPRRDTSPDKTLESVNAKAAGLPRAATSPALTAEAIKKGDMKLDLAELGIDRDAVLNTGKKMAIGIKDGLWTFWEDLRQATVGEDVVQIIPSHHLTPQSSTQTLRSPRQCGSKGSLRGSSRGSNASRKPTDTKLALALPPADKRSPARQADSSSHLPPLVDSSGLSMPMAEALASPRRTPTTSKRSSKHTKSPSIAVSTASSEGWDVWDDSPGFSRSSSATSQGTSHQSPAQDMQATPSKVAPVAETSPSSDPLPWPALSKYGGATLRRTASTLMSEWDKLDTPVSADQNVPNANDMHAQKRGPPKRD